MATASHSRREAVAVSGGPGASSAADRDSPAGGDVGVDPAQPGRELVVRELDEDGVGRAAVRAGAGASPAGRSRARRPPRAAGAESRPRRTPPRWRRRSGTGRTGGGPRGSSARGGRLSARPGEGAPDQAPVPRAQARGAARGRRRPGRPRGAARPTATRLSPSRRAGAGRGPGPRCGRTPVGRCAAVACRRMPGAGSTATTARPVQRASSGDQMPVPAPTSTTGPRGASARASATAAS